MWTPTFVEVLTNMEMSSVQLQTGFVIYVNGVLVSWASKLQMEIALSTMEAD
jgi:hypothetical protein